MFSPRPAWLGRAISLLLFVSFPVFAQSPASVSGCVQDSSRASVPGAAVVLQARDAFARVQARTDDKGCFNLTGIRAGNYHLQILAEAFSPFEKDIAIEDPVQLEDVVLEIHPIQSEVVVTATRSPAPADISTKNQEVEMR